MKLRENLQKILNLDRRKKSILLVFHDALILTFCFALSIFLRNESLKALFEIPVWICFGFSLLIALLGFAFLDVYKAVTRYLTTNIVVRLGCAVLISTLFMILIIKVFLIPIPYSIPIIYLIFSTCTITSSRQLIQDLVSKKSNQKKVAIYGAGKAGIRLMSALKYSDQLSVEMFIDDDPNKNTSVINGIIISCFDVAKKLIAQKKITLVLLALPSASLMERRDIMVRLNELNLQVKSIPSLIEIVEGGKTIDDLKQIQIEELLQRTINPPQSELMTKCLHGKTVLVTGAGGSIGSELCRQALAQNPGKLILVDNSEFNLFQIERTLKASASELHSSTQILPKLGSIQDISFIRRIFESEKIDTVFHAAAYKHVPMVEQNIFEAVKNNIVGTYNLVNHSAANSVSNFCLVSTDKAVRPTNIMGATKRFAELICQAQIETKNSTIFSIVRFGNVIASSGSVIPLFKEQIKSGGPLTVTHPNVTRYFMSIPEAAQLVVQATSLATGGEVFVLDMGEPVKILDLAKRMAILDGLKPYISDDADQSYPNIQIVFTGLRPGEKMYEELLIGDHARQTSHPSIRMAAERRIDNKIMSQLYTEIQDACANGCKDSLATVFKKANVEYNPSR